VKAAKVLKFTRDLMKRADFFNVDLSRGQDSGRLNMADKIGWETDFDTALTRAKAEKKPLFIDFFNPG